jgi:hypothetical protein
VPLPHSGDIASISYDYLTLRNKIPQNAKIFRIRTDLSWGEVVRNSAKAEQKILNGIVRGGRRREGKIKKNILFYFYFYFVDHSRDAADASPKRLQKKLKKMHLFLEHFAKKRGLDPLLPATWYYFSPKTLIAHVCTILFSFLFFFYFNFNLCAYAGWK